MSVAIAPCPSGIHSPSQDTALSPAAEELRDSIEDALNPRSATPEDDVATLLTRVSAALKKGFDREGVLVDVEPFGRMFDLLRTLPREIPLPDIVVESEHEIGLDWGTGRREVLSLTIDETPFIGFAALIGHEPVHGRALLAGSLPEILAHLFSRLYPSNHTDS
ncbi:MAG: hypothetical protein ACRD26_18210 [Vicinamibacterales bacterium]